MIDFRRDRLVRCIQGWVGLLVVGLLFIPLAAVQGETHRVPDGGDLQAALNKALPGDTIELAAGATYTGNFTIRAKSRNRPGQQPDRRWISVRSSGSEKLKPRGYRVHPEDAPLLAKIVSPDHRPALSTEFSASYYQFLGIEVTTTSKQSYNLVMLGKGGKPHRDARNIPELPKHIVFERCYLHGTSTSDSRCGMTINGRFIVVMDSYLSDFHSKVNEAQAITCWNGLGPFKIENNYIEGAGENILFGGSDPKIKNLVPSDIEIRRNYFSKPRSWQIGHKDFAGTAWIVKNIFELKNARRILIEGNIFENCWAHGQRGYAIVIKSSNQTGGAPWTTMEDITFQNNILRNTTSGFQISSRTNGFKHPSLPTRRVLIRNNLFENVSSAERGENGILFMFTSPDAGPPLQETDILHNTLLFGSSGKSFVSAGDTTKVAHGFRFEKNIVSYGKYGFSGSGKKPGLPTMTHYFSRFDFRWNVLITPSQQSSYPSGNYWAKSIRQVGFRDYQKRDYRLAPSSPFKGTGIERKDPGADIIELTAATRGVSRGVPNKPKAHLSKNSR